MANITICDLPNNTKEKLRVQATKSGVSLEAYARFILQKTSSLNAFLQPNILDLASKYFGHKNGVELELTERSSARKEANIER